MLPSGELDLFASDFKYPRVFRLSAGVDHLLPGEYLLTVEGQYTKTMDNVLVRNVNLRPQNDQLDGPDNRPVYNYDINRFGGLWLSMPVYGSLATIGFFGFIGIVAVYRKGVTIIPV